MGLDKLKNGIFAARRMTVKVRLICAAQYLKKAVQSQTYNYVGPLNSY